MMNCKNCGNVLNDGAKICQKCGTPVEIKLPEKKKKGKIIVKAIIAVVVVIAIIAGIFVFTEYRKKHQWDIIEFGSYPQSKVTDSATVSALDAIDKNWTSYGYYSGTSHEDGKMVPSDYMKYDDIEYNGKKYRAVTFSKYRPYTTSNEASTSTDHTYQDDNGYEINNIYYFKYEPLKWRVLDSDEGLIMCDTVIDSQAYNDFILCENGKYYGDSSKSYYASDWSKSSIRKWLNEDFYNTAFSSEEQAKIKDTDLKTRSTHDIEYDSADTTDKIFLLSYDDALNKSYGFDPCERSSASSNVGPKDPARVLKSTDYAQCQGCLIDSVSSAYWLLRSPIGSDKTEEVYVYGMVVPYYSATYINFNGIVPALKLK